MTTRLPSVLITGASTGIGREFARQFAARGWRVIATHRGKETPEALARLVEDYPAVQTATMDVTKPDEVAALADALHAQPLDILINNAGITKDDDGSSIRQNFGHYDFGLMDMIFATNVKGPLIVSQAFGDHLAAGDRKLLVTISSSHGSLTGPPGTLEDLQGTFYCASKAALNRAMQVMSHALATRGIATLMLHPGAVYTERYDAYVREHGDAWPRNLFIEPEESVSGMITSIDKARPADDIRFLDHEGTQLPW